MLKLLLILRMLLFKKKDNLKLKKRLKLKWKKKPNLLIDREEPQIMKLLEVMMVELQLDQEDQNDQEVLVLEPQEVAHRVDLQRRSSERESSR